MGRVTAPAHAARSPTRLSRDDIVALGRAGRPWEFLGIAAQALKIAPEDQGLRLLTAMNLARLGLRTLAEGQLRLAGESPEVEAVREVIGSLPADLIPFESLVSTATLNVQAMGDRAPGMAARLDEWASRTRGWQFLRCLDGNIVRRRASDEPREAGDLGAWLGLADLLSAARAFAAAHFKAGTTEKPVVVEGVDPPWLLRAIHEATPARKDGARQRLTVVQASELEFLNGLCQADLRGLLGDDRVEFFIGAGAGERLAATLRARLDLRIAGPCIPLTTLRERVSPPVEVIVREACAEQQREMLRLKNAAGVLYAGRGPRWWAQRYRRALAGEAEPGGKHEPLRVLVPTCRYSTFIQHSSRDLVGAFERAGTQARLLIEPDDASHFSVLAYLRQFTEFRPDLVVLINYTRANMNAGGEAMPAGVPWLCWVQDAMPHLYDRRIGQAQGALDFLAGHLHRELFTSFGYPMERLLPAPVAADEVKFHPGPVAPDLRRRHECEVAFVSHHSEMPEAMHARLMEETSNNAAVQRICGRLFPRVREAVARAMEECAMTAVDRAAREEVAREFGAAPDPKVLALVQRLYGAAMADRVMRHQTLEWALEVCERNSWRLRIYGRGWEKHPRFGPLACGELAHGEELRASYQGAAVHLHASVNTLVHQRVMECALSGGLPLCRLHRDAMSGVYAWAQSAACRRGEPTVCDIERRLPGYQVADHPELMSVMGQVQRLGIAPRALGCFAEARADVFRREAARLDTETHAGWLLGDLSETTFWSAQTLEDRIRRAVERPAWRAGVSASIAGRVRSRLTHGVLASRMISMIRDALGAEGGAAAAA
jgi:hypothetical protein